MTQSRYKYLVIVLLLSLCGCTTKISSDIGNNIESELSSTLDSLFLPILQLEESMDSADIQLQDKVLSHHKQCTGDDLIIILRPGYGNASIFNLLPEEKLDLRSNSIGRGRIQQEYGLTDEQITHLLSDSGNIIIIDPELYNASILAHEVGHACSMQTDQLSFNKYPRIESDLNFILSNVDKVLTPIGKSNLTDDLNKYAINIGNVSLLARELEASLTGLQILYTNGASPIQLTTAIKTYYAGFNSYLNNIK